MRASTLDESYIHRARNAYLNTQIYHMLASRSSTMAIYHCYYISHHISASKRHFPLPYRYLHACTDHLKISKLLLVSQAAMLLKYHPCAYGNGSQQVICEIDRSHMQRLRSVMLPRPLDVWIVCGRRGLRGR